jgi:hypothetical protein
MFSLVPAASASGAVAAATVCDWAQFVSDVTVPDGTNFAPGTAFRKTWRLRNIGTCAWTTSYTLVFDSGDPMGAPASVAMPNTVSPGQTVDLSVDMTAPSAAGHYFSYWRLKNASGVIFGIGSTANRAFWAEINVGSSSSGSGVAYDFTANAASATWTGGAGALTFPGTDGNANGFALRLEKPKFESGVESALPGLLFAPNNVTNGFIQASYPALRVQNGDRFQVTVGCEFNATSCFVQHRLDYQIGSGAVRTFWTFREKYEGLTKFADINLSSLAGQDVKFILYISAWGSPVGDRALWGNPIIARVGATPVTPVPVTPGTPVTPVPSACDRVQFVADVTVPDGTTFAPNTVFDKTWRLKNIGTCTWTTSYQVMFESGEKMGGPDTAPMPTTVAPGQTVDITVRLTAPSTPTAGTIRGYWKFKNASGVPFGWGSTGTRAWWVEIRVSGTPVTPSTPSTPVTPVTPSTPIAGVRYDFAANYCAASWHSAASSLPLPCPGTDGDARGFVILQNTPRLENGSLDNRPGLLTYPQNVNNGYIQGIFPSFRVQAGDRFRATIGCEGGATSCFVVYRLDYSAAGSSTISTFWAFVEKHEGLNYNADVDLSSLANQDIRFILTILSSGPPATDRALWIAPMIFNTSPGGATNTPTVTPTTVTSTVTPTGATPATPTFTLTPGPTNTSTVTTTPATPATPTYTLTPGPTSTSTPTPTNTP